MKMKVSVICLVVVAMALCAVAAQATLLTFDDIDDSEVPIANGYGGLNWDYFYVLDAVHYYGNPSGYQNGVVSPDNVVYNASGYPASMLVSSPALFHLNSAYLTAAWNDGLTVQVLGERQGRERILWLI